MFYTIIHDPDYKLDCKRCGRPLAHAVRFVNEGEMITVGRECAKHYGIRWTAKVGPAADDPEMFSKAVEIWRVKRNDAPRYRWPGGWESCQTIKDALGTEKWDMAKMVVHRERE